MQGQGEQNRCQVFPVTIGTGSKGLRSRPALTLSTSMMSMMGCTSTATACLDGQEQKRRVQQGTVYAFANVCNRRGLFPRAPAGDALMFDVNSLNRTPTFASPLQGLDAGEASAMPCASVCQTFTPRGERWLGYDCPKFGRNNPGQFVGNFPQNRPGRHDQRGTLQPWRWRKAWLLPLNLPSLFRRLLSGTP